MAIELDEIREYERQKDYLDSVIKYLKNTESNFLCLKSEGVLPSNYVWITKLNFDLIDVKSLIDDIKELTIKRLEVERMVLDQMYKSKLARLAFMAL